MSIAMKRYTASEPIAPRSHDPDQLRVLPAQDRRAARAARPYRGPAAGAVAGIRLVHVWCRRLDPGLHARDRGAPARDARAGRRAARVGRGRTRRRTVGPGGALPTGKAAARANE